VSILDRYIARQFIINILVLLVLLGGFVVLVDASLNLARNLQLAQEQLAKAGDKDPSAIRKFLAAGLFILDLWWPRLLQLFNYLNGLVLIAAMGFTYTQLVRSREVVAALAGGISLRRLLRPVLVVTGVMLMIQVANQELVVPKIAPLILRNNTDVAKRDLAAFPVLLVPDSAGRLWSAASFDPPTKLRGASMTGVSIWERDASGRATRRFSADRADYEATKSGWVLKNLTVTNLSVIADGAPVPGTAATATPARPIPGGLEPGAVRTIQTDLDPTALLADRYKAFSQVLSWSQLLEASSSPAVKPELRESFTRLAWGRGAMLMCTVLSILICAPFFLTREPKNMVLQSLKCAPVAIGSVIGSIIGTAAAIPGLPPELAVMIPVMAMVTMAIPAVTGMRT
jgi:lipopolysaccharide export system permease protein